MSDTLKTMIENQNNLMMEIMASDGEITPELEAKLNDLDVSIPSKIDAYYLIMDRLENESDYFKSKAEEFLLAAKQMSQAKERIKDRLKFIMQSENKTELLGNDYKFSLSKSKPKVAIQENLVPIEYYKQVIEERIEKDRIAEDLKAGISIPGCHLEDVFAFRSSVNKKLIEKKKSK